MPYRTSDLLLLFVRDKSACRGYSPLFKKWSKPAHFSLLGRWMFTAVQVRCRQTVVRLTALFPELPRSGVPRNSASEAKGFSETRSRLTWTSACCLSLSISLG